MNESHLLWLEHYDGIRVRNRYFHAVEMGKLILDIRKNAKPGEWFVLRDARGVLMQERF